jgi:O-antigen/teichoic acid export membrane protein
MTATSSSWRTANVLRQLKGGIGYRAGAMVLSFLALPIMIGVLGTEQFGVWSTLLSIMSWAVFFDLGIGNGLRNKVAATLADDDKTEARLYIASGYTMIGLVVFTIWVTLTAASYFVPWQVVFNTTAISENELRQTFQITAFFVLLNFWIGLVAILFSAVQQTSFVELGRLITNLLVLIFVVALAKTEASSIRNMAVLYGTALVFANLLLSVLFFKPRRDLRPTIHLNLQHARPLLTLGSQFFVIQLAVLIIFTTDKILITQFFGAERVTEYDVVFKIFSLVMVAHGLIMAPLWSAYTDAYQKQDMAWIRQMLRRQLQVFGGLTVVVFLLALSTQKIVDLWIGDSLDVSSTLVFCMAFFALVSTWNNIFAFIVNGIGKIRLQLVTAVIAMFSNIPLTILFIKTTGMGEAAVVLATIASLLLAAVALPIQVWFMLRQPKMDAVS